MNFKKTIAKSLVVAMALGMVPVANLQTAKAAAPVITFAPETGLATTGSGKFWAIAKEDPKGTVTIGTKKYKITNVQDVSDAIDVYAALKGKAGIIAVGEKPVPDGNWVIKEFAEADKTFKVQFIASAGAIKKGPKPAALNKVLGGDFGYLFATDGKTPAEYDLSTAANQTAVEVKLNDGHWKTFKDFFGVTGATDSDAKLVNTKLKALGQSGSTLSFRIAATATAYASKESKVKIAAQAKAPVVKADVTKDTIAIKKGMMWQLVDEGAAADDTKWKTVTDTKGLPFANIGFTDTKNEDILVRTGATEKKIASKVGRVSLRMPAAKLTVPANGFKAADNQIGTNIVVEPVLAYDIKKGLNIISKSDKDLEYTLLRDGDAIKWNTLKASKNPATKPAKATLKYSATAKAGTWNEDGKVKLYVRVAGTKQDKQNVATRAGVSNGAVLAFENVKQPFTLKTGSAASSTDGVITAANANTKAAIQVASGKAVTFTIKANIANVVNKKGGTPKLTPIEKLPSGVTIKAGKIDGTTGDFDITVNVSNRAFKENTFSVAAKYGVKYEGADGLLDITITQK